MNFKMVQVKINKEAHDALMFYGVSEGTLEESGDGAWLIELDGEVYSAALARSIEKSISISDTIVECIADWMLQ